MKYDMVFVDDSFVQCPEKVPSNAIHLDSGIKEDTWEARRYRIAYMLREIFSRVNDDLLLVDSDVYIPPISIGGSIYTFCIPARAKPSNDVTLFCMSTNLFIPSSFLKFARDVMDEYLKNEIWKNYYVDIYLYSKLLPIVKILPGTYHYINGKKYIISDSYLIKVEQ
jgi:hypothetical protein